MLIKNSFVVLGLIFICLISCCNGRKAKPSPKPAKAKPEPGAGGQRQSQRVRGDEDIMAGQVPIKNGTVRLLENGKFNVANLSRTATYDEEYDYAGDDAYEAEGGAVPVKAERDREKPSCHSDKNVGGCQRSERERRYYYSKHRGCLRFKGCPDAGGNNYKSLHSCQTECGRRDNRGGSDYYGEGRGSDYYEGGRGSYADSYRGRGYRNDYGRPYRSEDYGRPYYY